MSIIERFARLLDPVEQPTPRPSAPASGPTNPALDLIERSIAKELARPPSAANQAPERTPGSTTPVRPAGQPSRSARTVSIDLARLRRQGIVAPGGERTATAESFRRIKRRILASALDPKPNLPANLVIVTSALPGEGKTFCSINLAISIALEVDHSVLLVDADVRKPSIPEVLGVAGGKGLMDLLGDRRIDLAEVLCRTNIGKLTLLPAGTSQERATELLASATTRELLGEMAARYRDRIIIFDSPPLLAASETSVLASHMGQVVVVVESGKTTESALKEALGRIDSKRLTGLVLNKASGAALQSYYGGYGSGA